LCTALLAVAMFIVLRHKNKSSGDNALTPPELTSEDNAPTPPQLTGKTQPTEVELPILNEQGMKLVMYLLMDDMKGAIGGAHTLLAADDTLLLTGIDLQTTAEQYDADYDANEVAADQKYEGKKLLLTGVIESINEDFKGDAYVVLKGSNPLMGVHAELNERGKAGASALAKGTTIYLVCDSGTRIIGSAVARNCQQFSQHLDQIRPSLKSAVEKQLQEQSSTPTKLAQALRMMYVLGAQLPPDSPCFTGTGDACKASLAAIFEDKAKMQALTDQIRRTFPAGASSNSPPEDVAQLMAQEDALDDKCRGGSGDDEATLKACDEAGFDFQKDSVEKLVLGA
jgi:tRNA_anti-like